MCVLHALLSPAFCLSGLKALKRENRLLVQQEVRGNVEKKEISGE